MHLRIAQLAPPFESIPPFGYGGTERVIASLTEELVRRGHRVTLFAAGDSRSSARLVPVVPESLWHLDPPTNDLEPYRARMEEAILAEIDDFDVVHSHLDWRGFGLADEIDGPMLTTLHGRLDVEEVYPLYRQFADLPLVSISDSQRHPLPIANWLATVYHGIDLATFPFQPTSAGYLAFLGRISADKGVDIAIRVARRAGMPLLIAARPPLAFFRNAEGRRDREYYEQVVEPLLREPGIELIGEVGGPDKLRLLGNAAALMFPIRWPEPFGLVMPEALACGTPVIALRQGSVPEIIESGVSGFVGHTEDDLLAAVGRIGEIDRRRCRIEAERRFSTAVMADAYEAVYADLLAPAPAIEEAAPPMRARLDLRWA